MKQSRNLVPYLATALVAGCAAGAESGADPEAPVADPVSVSANANATADELRAQGPAGLERALAAYDAATGAEREALALVVDRVAGQRYATHSRLYWHTELAAAKAAAARRGVPILSLRMLGRLDEDLSCANSRFFRVALYANQTVAAYLRDNFVLHWSSERAVPRATIDFGDGRVIETTVAGNSAHYVLDANGQPVDVVPGLYGPAAFIEALEPARAFAASVAGVGGDDRDQALIGYHAGRLQATTDRFGAGLSLITRRGASLVDAERLTVSKAMVEMPVARGLGLGADVAGAAREDAVLAARMAGLVAQPVLDASSRALIAELAPTNWAHAGEALDGESLTQLIDRFQAQLAAETVINEAGIRYLVHSWFATGDAPRGFEALNARVYSELFRTPAADPWLGMSTAGVFTGLPADGVRVQ